MNRAFAWLWTGQTFSVIAEGFALLAIPSIAILTLHATPLQVGLLEALQTLAYPLLGLPAGVLVDRWPRTRVLASSNIVRAVALAMIPLAAATQHLSIGLLAVVTAVVGILDVFFAVAYQAVLPDIVETALLPRANARLTATQSLAQALGAGGGGAIVGLIGAPRAVIAIAASFAISAAALANLRLRAKTAEAIARAPSFRREVREGWTAVFQTRGLAQLLGCTATSNLGSSMFGAAYLLFVYRTLHIAPALVGVIFVVGELGFIGALFAPRISAKLGFARTLIMAQGLAAIASATVPLAAVVHHRFAAVAVLICTQACWTCAVPIYNVVQISYRQSAIATELQGRANATTRTIVWGTMPIGAALGGLLAGRIGFAATLEAGSAIMLASLCWLATPVIRSLRPAT